MLIIISGKSGSGKTTIVNLLSKQGYKPIIATTTRPKRKGEIDGVTYHFKTKEEFEKLIEQGHFAEYKIYHSAIGDLYYGTAKEDIANATGDRTIILTPKAIRELKHKFTQDIFIIYLFSREHIIKRRLATRGDNESEVDRRIKADNEDFRLFEIEADRVFINNSLSDLKVIVEEIILVINERKIK